MSHLHILKSFPQNRPSHTPVYLITVKCGPHSCTPHAARPAGGAQCFPPPLTFALSDILPHTMFSVSMSLFVFCLFICFVFQILHAKGIAQYLSFSVRLISLSIMASRPIHFVTNGKITFFFRVNILYHILLIHSSIEGDFICSHVGAIMSNAAMNTGVHLSF